MYKLTMVDEPQPRMVNATSYALDEGCLKLFSHDGRDRRLVLMVHMSRVVELSEIDEPVQAHAGVIDL